MKILNVAYPFAPAGPDAVGGAEQVLTQLVEALVAAGHHSLAVAREDSVLPGTVLPVPRLEEAIRPETRRRIHGEVKGRIEEAMAREAIDLIHFHGIDFCEYLPETGLPMLITLHLPIPWYPPWIFDDRGGNIHLQCVSPAQQRAVPGSVPLPPVIENGVPIERLQGRYRRRNFALSLGRICPEKGFHHAAQAARKAGIDFLLGGEVFPYETHQNYFHDQLRPVLDRRRRFLGPVGFRQKRRLLNSARCLLIPSLAPETSSLVAMEAMACGTPVIAFAAGALPDLIEHGKTGLLAQDEREMADAILAASRLDPEVCRAQARRRFSVQRMTRQYLELYERLIEPPVFSPALKNREVEQPV